MAWTLTLWKSARSTGKIRTEMCLSIILEHLHVQQDWEDSGSLTLYFLCHQPVGNGLLDLTPSVDS